MDIFSIYFCFDCSLYNNNSSSSIFELFLSFLTKLFGVFASFIAFFSLTSLSIYHVGGDGSCLVLIVPMRRLFAYRLSLNPGSGALTPFHSKTFSLFSLFFCLQFRIAQARTLWKGRESVWRVHVYHRHFSLAQETFFSFHSPSLFLSLSLLLLYSQCLSLHTCV